MKQYRSSGIVLKKQRNFVLFLDQQMGIINIVCFFEKLFLGSLYEYCIEQLGEENYKISEIELVFMPLQIARADLDFLHYLIYFVQQTAPIGSCVEGLFSLFQYMYSLQESWFSRRHKQYMLFKVATLLGFFPMHLRTSLSLLRLAHLPIDSIPQEAIDLVAEEELQEWLIGCILQLPQTIRDQKPSFFFPKPTEKIVSTYPLK